MINNGKKTTMNDQALSRRWFIQAAGIGLAGVGLSQVGCTAKKVVQAPTGADGTIIPGFERTAVSAANLKKWMPISDRKIKVGIVGYGYCRFGALFAFQDHPNVEVVAVSDLFPDRCAELAKACRVTKTYPSLEELVKDDQIEAVFVATDAPSHAKHCIEALKHGKHVAVAVPAVWGSLEDADKLFETVKSSGLKYMMFETACYHEDVHAMREIYRAGGFGEVVYSEGEYYHYMPEPLPGYNNWRDGLPPMWYCTHASAYQMCVTGGSLTEVSCAGWKSNLDYLQPDRNRYHNPFGTEVGVFKTSEGGMSRIAISWDTNGWGAEQGRLRGERGAYNCLNHANCSGSYSGEAANSLPDVRRPGLPPGVSAGGHGGSHGQLTNEFVGAILENRKPLVDIGMALNLTVPGIVAHQSALKGGELLKIPQYRL